MVICAFSGTACRLIRMTLVKLARGHHWLWPESHGSPCSLITNCSGAASFCINIVSFNAPWPIQPRLQDIYDPSPITDCLCNCSLLRMHSRGLGKLSARRRNAIPIFMICSCRVSAVLLCCVSTLIFTRSAEWEYLCLSMLIWVWFRLRVFITYHAFPCTKLQRSI